MGLCSVNRESSFWHNFKKILMYLRLCHASVYHTNNIFMLCKLLLGHVFHLAIFLAKLNIQSFVT